MTKAQKAALKKITSTPQTAKQLAVNESSLLALVCQERIKCTRTMPKQFYV